MCTVARSLRLPKQCKCGAAMVKMVDPRQMRQQQSAYQAGHWSFSSFPVKALQNDCSFWQHAHNPHNEGPCRKCSVVSDGAHLVTISRRAFWKPTNQPSFLSISWTKGSFPIGSALLEAKCNFGVVHQMACACCIFLFKGMCTSKKTVITVTRMSLDHWKQTHNLIIKHNVCVLSL